MSVNPLGNNNPYLNILLKSKELEDEGINISPAISTQPQIIPSFYTNDSSDESANAALNHVASKVGDSDSSQQVQFVNNQNDTEPFVVKVSVQDLGEQRWSSKIDPQDITRQTYIKAAMQMGLSEEQAKRFADEYGIENPFVVDGDKIREMKRSDLDNAAIIYKNTDEWGRYQSKTSQSLLKAIQDYKDKLKEAETNQLTTPILLAGTTAVMPSQPINLELPKVVPVVTKAARLLAEAAVPAAMLGAGVAAQGKVLYDWGQIEYARQAANAKTSVMPLPPSPAIMTDKTETKTPVVPDIGLPTDEELPKGELAKAGPVTTGAPTTFTTPNIQPTSPTGGPEKIPPIVGPIIGGTTATIGTLLGSPSSESVNRIEPSMQPDPTRKPNGVPEKPNNWGTTKQNESAELLSQAGYDVEYQPKVTPDDLKIDPSLKPDKNPDYRIEGKIFDCLATSSPRALNVRDKIADKTNDGQTMRILLNLDESSVSLDDLKQVLTDTPVRDLKELIIVKDGEITHFFPFE